jgi:antitoxin component YwqK of YwqJK toxin-antitoxin module
MRPLLIVLLLAAHSGFAQWKDFKLINDGKDTINRIDQEGHKQFEWVIHHEPLRGEPGYEEEGEFLNDRKEGEWRLFSLMGDLVGIEHYRWGNKDGNAQYFSNLGDLRMEQNWKALNPDKVYDTIMVEDVDKLETFHEVIVKNEGASLKHGLWKYYDVNGALMKTENYVLGKLEKGSTVASTDKPKVVEKPKEVLDFEKKHSGKKKIRYQDGTTK